VSKTADIKRVADNFHRHAAEYDRYASVQKLVVSRLLQLVDSHLEGAPENFLDIGCGTGNLLNALGKRFPASQPFGIDLAFNMALAASANCGPEAVIINANAEELPFAGSGFDLIVSASTFQWINNLDLCLAECYRTLKDGGLFCAAFFGGKTLHELHQSYRNTIEKYFGANDERIARLHKFMKVDDVRPLLENSGFSQVMVFSEIETEYHDDVAGLLRSIKKIGAATANSHAAGNGLGWRGVIAEMQDHYTKKYQVAGRIPATYEVVYLLARK